MSDKVKNKSDNKTNQIKNRVDWKALIGTGTRILIAAELLLLLIGIVGVLLGKSEILYAWDSMEQAEMTTVRLSRGTYSAVVRYDYTGENLNPGSVDLLVEDGGYRSVFANGIPIYAGTSENSLDFTVAAKEAVVRVVSDREEALRFSSVEIVRTRAGNFKFVCVVLFFSLLLDFLVLVKSYDTIYTLSDSAKLRGIAVPAAALLSSVPSFTDYNIMGADMMFHLMRIEALRTAILNGELHVRMQSLWLAGHGYANSFFYGDTLLFFPAFLRVMGFTPDFTYRVFILMINLLTAYIAYYSFSRMFGESQWGVQVGTFASILYTLAPYRIYNCYNRSAMGEFAAMTFLPLLLYGFYRIYQADQGERKYRFSFLIPMVGFSGIIQSHMLTCEMAGLFTVIFCLVMWKKTFTRKIFTQLCLVVVTTVLVNAWYLVPCLDLMASDSYYFGHNANVLIQDRGIYLWQIFYTLQAAGSSSKYPETGFVDAEPISMGIALLAGVLLFAWKLGQRKWSEEEIKWKKTGIILSVLLVVALFFSTSLFPWNFLSAHGLNGVIGPIQFPTRFTSVVSVFAVAVCCIGALVWKKKEIFYLIAALSVIFAVYQTNDISQTAEEQIRIYNGNGMGTTAILGAEYLPEGASVGHMIWHLPVASEGVTYTDYEKKGLRAQAVVRAENGGTLDFPMLYYKGYTAIDQASGAKFAIQPGTEYDVRVNLPVGYDGTVLVSYAGMWYWHAAEAVSVLAGMLLLFRWGSSRRNLK